MKKKNWQERLRKQTQSLDDRGASINSNVQKKILSVFNWEKNKQMILIGACRECICAFRVSGIQGEVSIATHFTSLFRREGGSKKSLWKIGRKLSAAAAVSSSLGWWGPSWTHRRHPFSTGTQSKENSLTSSLLARWCFLNYIFH